MTGLRAWLTFVTYQALRWHPAGVLWVGGTASLALAIVGVVVGLAPHPAVSALGAAMFVIGVAGCVVAVLYPVLHWVVGPPRRWAR